MNIKIISLFLAFTSLNLFASGTLKEPDLSNEKLVELIGEYYGSRLPFTGVSLTIEEQEAFSKGIIAGILGKSDKNKINKNMMMLEKTLTGLVKKVQDKKNLLQKEKMSSVVFPMNTMIQRSNGEKVSLTTLAKGKKAIYLDFWATWCGPCMANMPNLINEQKELSEKGVVVVGMNTEGVEEAEKVRVSKNISFDWLVEPKGSPFSQLLMIDTIPRIIILSTDGKVVYNGSPHDKEAIDTALKSVGVNR